MPLSSFIRRAAQTLFARIVICESLGHGGIFLLAAFLIGISHETRTIEEEWQRRVHLQLAIRLS